MLPIMKQAFITAKHLFTTYLSLVLNVEVGSSGLELDDP